jgi:hypothetical protein
VTQVIDLLQLHRQGDKKAFVPEAALGDLPPLSDRAEGIALPGILS